MSLRRYGIYIAYPPTEGIAREGLGRYLAAFLKGAAQRRDVRFVLVCPSWSHKGLAELLVAESVPKDSVEIHHPGKAPIILRAYEAYSAYRRRLRKHTFPQWLAAMLRRVGGKAEDRVLQRIASALTPVDLLPLLFGGLLILLLTPLFLLVALVYFLARAMWRATAKLARPLAQTNTRMQRTLAHPEDDTFVLRMYKLMEQAESKRMLKVIEGLTNVRAWYCPTAFWPSFHKIPGPRLMCVPDVVLHDFAVDFSQLGADRFLQTFVEVESAIRSASNFVTYSDAVKWDTLVDRYAVNAQDVAVVRHAPIDLKPHIVVSGFDESAAVSRRYCEWQFSQALGKSDNPGYAKDFPNRSVKFLFYASQFRPNKNLIMLLRAYECLLRQRRIVHKLVLTGKPSVLPAVEQFIREHALRNDVLCLHGLSSEELAACYKLADLAVNPSLSEGGCPFTFAEALSVGTPVVMSRIAVTEEVLTDPVLQQMSFFDPHDWNDIANRIEWALCHREELLSVQLATYETLAKRSWGDVVGEHIDILDRISA